jgi:hypothetical protein
VHAGRGTRAVDALKDLPPELTAAAQLLASALLAVAQQASCISSGGHADLRCVAAAAAGLLRVAQLCASSSALTQGLLPQAALMCGAAIGKVRACCVGVGSQAKGQLLFVSAYAA